MWAFPSSIFWRLFWVNNIRSNSRVPCWWAWGVLFDGPKYCSTPKLGKLYESEKALPSGNFNIAIETHCFKQVNHLWTVLYFHYPWLSIAMLNFHMVNWGIIELYIYMLNYWRVNVDHPIDPFFSCWSPGKILTPLLMTLLAFKLLTASGTFGSAWDFSWRLKQWLGPLNRYSWEPNDSYCSGKVDITDLYETPG